MHEVDDAVGNCCSLLHGVTGSRYVAKVVLISGYRALALERISRGNPAVAVRHLLCRQIALLRFFTKSAEDWRASNGGDSHSPSYAQIPTDNAIPNDSDSFVNYPYCCIVSKI